MKRTMLALFAVAILIGPIAVAQPQPAAADCSILPTWINLISAGLGCLALPFGDAGLATCPMQQVDVSVAPTDGSNGTDKTADGIRIYRYDIACSSTDLIHVSAEFNTVTQRGSEKITGDSGYLQGLWTCSNDPWITSSQTPITCTNGGIEATNSAATNFRLADATLPISSVLLSTYSHHVLDEQLQNAFKQAAQPVPTNPHAVQTTSSNSCTACVFAGSLAPSTLPAPAGFSGQRDNLYGTTDVLSWQSVAGADYYKLTAQGQVSGTPLAVGGGADIAGSATSFVVSGTAAEITGGTDFFLQACSVANGCGAKAQTTVVGP
jgi:hypothetical protein